MATNFNNKYLQVLQNYDEFGEYSADYVKGEDHVAFLIEENEVIYWLYLEQVWRPLNVRTTKIGELEDGRTKVAVKLEYVEGGQKYTSVPNIPDPERITSMSHFLENYPDIEEVNVNGTVNLTDLSYAFAGSKIKDFSMLDTSNVTNIVGIFNNINDKNLDLNIKLDISKIANSTAQQGVTVNSISFTNINKDNYIPCNLNFRNCNINILNLDDFGFTILINNNGLTIKTINSNKEVRFSDDPNKANGNNEINNINCDEFAFGVTSVKANNELIVNCNTAKISTYGESNYTTESKTIFETVNDLTFDINGNGIINFKFGSGIKYPSNVTPKLTRFDYSNVANTIGNFWFITPIVNDAFYADKQYAVSIFQYKTAFTEIADVNISKDFDSNLLYIDWNSINFDLSNTSIELYNNININTQYYSGNIKKLIIDNSNVDGINKENCPYLHDFYSNRINATEGHISGIFKSYRPNNEDYSRISENNLLKNITLVDFMYMLIYNGDFLKNNNIKFDYVNRNKYIKLNVSGNKLTELDTLINNNNININLANDNSGDISYSKRIKNIDGVIFNIGNSAEDSYTNIYMIIDLLFEGNNNIINSTIRIGIGSPNNEQIKESVYINGNSKLKYFYDSYYSYNKYNYIIKNIYGNNLIIYIDKYSLGLNENWNLSPYKHIDINSVILEDLYNEFHILCFVNCDNETTINLITNLIDNTSSSSKTIYMYRSQADIIGEENITAAVAKNYEIAIIEN